MAAESSNISSQTDDPAVPDASIPITSRRRSRSKRASRIKPRLREVASEAATRIVEGHANAYYVEGSIFSFEDTQ